jgi:hypothetical protein
LRSSEFKAAVLVNQHGRFFCAFELPLNADEMQACCQPFSSPLTETFRDLCIE